MLRGLSIKARLLGFLLPALGLGFLCTLILAIEGYLGIKNLHQTTESLEARSIERIASFADLKDLINQAPVALRDFVLSQSEEQRLKILGTREMAFSELAERVEVLKKEPSQGQSQAFKRREASVADHLSALRQFDKQWKGVSSGPLPGEIESVLREQIWNVILPYRVEVQENINNLQQLEIAHQNVLAKESQSSYRKTQNVIVSSAVFAFLLTSVAAILALYVLNSISNFLSSIAAALGRTSKSVESTSVALSASSTQLASATTQEASSIAETAAAMEEIQDKTRVINDIVFETRLLSFNASIEAARAGSQGRGFAVVAEEVGNLAVVSGKAADEIRVLLESTTSEVNEIVRGTQERINQGRTRAEECEQAFGAMGETLSRVGQYVKGISAAAHEQDSGVKQINRAMAQLDTVTQSNASGAEDLNAQATQLALDSERMGIAVAQLVHSISGTRNATDQEDAENEEKSDDRASGQPNRSTQRRIGSKRKSENSKLAARVTEINRRGGVEPAGERGQQNAEYYEAHETIDRDDSRWKQSA